MEEFCGGVFWDIKLVLHTSIPDFPLCFQKLVLVLASDVFLWLLLPFVIISINRRSYKNFHIPWRYLNIFKISSTAILLLISIAFLVLNAISYMNSDAAAVDVLYPAVEICTYLLVITIELVHKKSCIHSSGILFTYWLLKTVGCLFIFLSTMQRALQPEDYIDDMPQFVLTIISVNFIFVVFNFLMYFKLSCSK